MRIINLLILCLGLFFAHVTDASARCDRFNEERLIKESELIIRAQLLEKEAFRTKEDVSRWEQTSEPNNSGTTAYILKIIKIYKGKHQESLQIKDYSGHRNLPLKGDYIFFLLPKSEGDSYNIGTCSKVIPFGASAMPENFSNMLFKLERHYGSSILVKSLIDIQPKNIWFHKLAAELHEEIFEYDKSAKNYETIHQIIENYREDNVSLESLGINFNVRHKINKKYIQTLYKNAQYKKILDVRGTYQNESPEEILVEGFDFGSGHRDSEFWKYEAASLMKLGDKTTIQNIHKKRPIDVSDLQIHNIDMSNLLIDGANFTNASLSFSNIQNTSFKDANFKKAKLQFEFDNSADFSDALYDCCTVFPYEFDPVNAGMKGPDKGWCQKNVTPFEFKNKKCEPTNKEK